MQELLSRLDEALGRARYTVYINRAGDRDGNRMVEATAQKGAWQLNGRMELVIP
jgi:hypothetical protein